MLEKFSRKIHPKLLLILILVLALFLRLKHFAGMYWSDDMWYSNIASQILKGTYRPGALTSMRLMLVYPLSFFFWVFGISEISGGIYSLLTSMSMISLVYFFGKRFFGVKTGLIGAFILSMFPLNVLYSTRMMVDVPLAFFTTLSVFIFLEAEFNRRNRLFYFLSGVFTGLAYLVKLTGLLPMVFFVFYFIFKTLKKRKIDFKYFLIIFGFLTLVLCEGLFYHFQVGDFLLRFHNAFGYYSQEERLTYEFKTDFSYYPRVMFGLTNKYFGFFYYFFFLAMLFLLFEKNNRTKIMILWFFSFFLYLQFGTMTFTHYTPLHRLDRHLTVISVPSVLILSCFLSRLSGKSVKHTTLIFIMVILLSFQFLISINEIHSMEQGSIEDMSLLYDFFKNKPLKTIYADHGTVAHLKLYFHYTRNNFFRPIFRINCNEIRDSFIVLNATRGWIESKPFISELPNCVLNPPEEWELVKEIDSDYKKGIYGQFNPMIYYAP